MKLSFIVPIYNVERYLSRCVASLYEQSLSVQDFEVILVNDGSTDNSYEIAKKIASEHDNIKLFSQYNQGLSGARNTGLEHAIGDYVSFVDSDDYLLPNQVNYLLEVLIDKKLDICSFGYRFEYHSKQSDCHPVMVLDTLLSGEFVLLHDMNLASVCTNIYSRSIIESNHMRFKFGIVHEDVEFNNRIFIYAKRVMFLNNIVYYYTWNENSLSRGKDMMKLQKNLYDDIIIASYLRKNSLLDGISQELRNQFIRKSNSVMISTFLTLLKNKSFDYQFSKKCIELAKQELVYPISGYSLSWKTSLLVPLMNKESFLIFLLKLYK